MQQWFPASSPQLNQSIENGTIHRPEGLGRSLNVWRPQFPSRDRSFAQECSTNLRCPAKNMSVSSLVVLCTMYPFIHLSIYLPNPDPNGQQQNHIGGQPSETELFEGNILHIQTVCIQVCPKKHAELGEVQLHQSWRNIEKSSVSFFFRKSWTWLYSLLKTRFFCIFFWGTSGWSLPKLISSTTSMVEPSAWLSFKS